VLAELLSDVRYRLRALFGRADAERDLDDELRFHVDTEAERLARGGMPRDEARRRARIALGGVELLKERTRDAWGVLFLQQLWRDLGHAMRLAARHAGFTAVVVFSLALGIGATTAVFSLTYNVLFAQLRVPHPEQLVALGRSDKSDSDDGFTWAEYDALKHTPGAGAFAAVRGASAVAVVAGEQRELINIQFVEGSFFPLMGIRPVAGRLLSPDDDARGAPVVVLAKQFAERMFPGDSTAVGRTLLIRGAPFTVVGVTPRSFMGLDFPGWFTAAIPLGAVSTLGGPGAGSDNRGERYGAGDERASDRRAFQIVGRIATAPAAARAALALTFARCCPKTAGERLDVIDIRRGIAGGKDDFRPQARMILGILLSGMALLLVVVCCNIASLLLVRASARQREIAVRLALGASRARLMSQLMIENAPHAIAGGIGGVLVAAWYTSIFMNHLPPEWAGSSDMEQMLGMHVGPALIAFTTLVTIGCCLGFAVYPALRATASGFAGALRLDARASRTRGQGVVTRGVVVAQVAVTIMLVTAASLFLITLGNLSRVDGGFAVDHVLITGLEARSTRYERTGTAPVIDEIVRRVRHVPGVRAATASTMVPLYGGANWRVRVRPPGFTGEKDKLPVALASATVPGYFDALGTKLASGRDFAPSDVAGAEPVVVVSAAFARRYYAGRDPLGEALDIQLGDDAATAVRIVGVAGDVKVDLRAAPEALLYFPIAQTRETWHSAQVTVRTVGEPAEVTRAVARAIEVAAPGMIVRNVREMRTVRDGAMMVERLAARLAGFVSAMALVLSVVGLYGVVAYSVSRRTSEIGIRLALGARPRALLWLVARETIALVGVGVLVGIPLAFAASGALRSQLFGVGARDPSSAVLAVGLLAVAGLVASVIPARRAVTVEPRVVLGGE
jgi:putative ABC transport system permease protein